MHRDWRHIHLLNVSTVWSRSDYVWSICRYPHRSRPIQLYPYTTVISVLNPNAPWQNRGSQLILFPYRQLFSYIFGFYQSIPAFREFLINDHFTNAHFGWLIIGGTWREVSSNAQYTPIDILFNWLTTHGKFYHWLLLPTRSRFHSNSPPHAIHQTRAALSSFTTVAYHFVPGIFIMANFPDKTLLAAWTIYNSVSLNLYLLVCCS